ncbi:sigma-70 family RNA polymerase sigma factor [Mucilaginibacter sp. HMF5004]|uniref:RNA polymerase sigma factor n=1 Tax=Mucilaginibacter rivuli TaxID=2857527 RepID=UPI001C5F8131|nr:sigma-70 family RNA polymerase sigma factor [Mucilaginibacter rivuli]MBW4891393.1 sigma-70 family RNA polymerase sigma factor [Mucilaginibacter rivuli]
MGEEELQQLIEGCKNQDRKCQKMLYKALYGFAMGICLRYAGNRYEASEIMNTGFFKAMTNMHKYDPAKPFKAWLGRIMMNTSIDYYRANLKVAYTEELDQADHIGECETVSSKLGYDELLKLVQKLPEAYRTVFNLFAIDGYTHEEIGEMLGINPGTSKSNLHKARQKLQKMLLSTSGTGVGEIRHSSIVAIRQTDVTDIYFNKGFRP